MQLKKLWRYPVVIAFFLFIFVFWIWDMLAPTREFSEMENMYLKQRPTFSWSSLVDTNEERKYTAQYEEYVNEQFVLRDQWISLKSRAESAIGKVENNGIVYGTDGYMFAKEDTYDEQKLQTNIDYLNEFMALYPEVPKTFAVIPTAYAVMPQRLPYGLQLLDQYDMMQQIYGQVQGDELAHLSFNDVLDAHQEEYIYYRTDHHWTTYGAWLAYSEYVRSKGMEPVSLEELDANEVEGFLGTHYSKCKLYNAQADTITYYDIPITDITVDGGHTILDADRQELTVEGLYNMQQWQVRDKYAAFLWGNNGVTVIKSDNSRYHEDGKTSRVMVIKDSYANSFVPFLTYNYDEIVVIDLRALATDLSELMEQYTFDDVLIMYNFSNFLTDTNFFKLRY